MNEWCRIVDIDGKLVLFVREYEAAEDEYKLKMTIHGEDWVKGCGMDATISLGKSDDPFTDENFNKFANKETANILINKNIIPLLEGE